LVSTQNWGMYEVADKAFDAMQSTIARQKLAAYPPDIEIEILRNACGTLEFSQSAEMIELGYQKAKEYANNQK
jgi:NTE family protein